MPETTSPSVNERAHNLEILAATPAALKEALRGVPRKVVPRRHQVDGVQAWVGLQ